MIKTNCVVQNAIVRNALAWNASYESNAEAYLSKRKAIVNRIVNLVKDAVEEDDGNARIYETALSDMIKKDPENKLLGKAYLAITNGHELFAGAIRSMVSTLARL